MLFRVGVGSYYFHVETFNLIAALVALLGLVGCGGKKEPGEQEGPAAEVVAPDVMPEGLSDEARAEWLIDRGRYVEALPLLETVVEARREAGGVPLGASLMGLGMVRDALGQAEEALGPLAEAWDIFQQEEAPLEMRGACADALGLACQGADLFEDAERAFLKRSAP